MSKKGSVLILGAGRSSFQRVGVYSPGETPPSNSFFLNFEDIWTIDIDPEAKPKITWDLETSETFAGRKNLIWPVPNGFFDEVHAYELLEHLGRMGDYEFFFALWRKIWEVLKPGGVVCATTPWWESSWAWGDPGHRVVYSPALLIYLDQDNYLAQVGHTAMTDYRRFFPPPYSFKVRNSLMTSINSTVPDPRSAGFTFVLQKVDWKNESKN